MLSRPAVILTYGQEISRDYEGAKAIVLVSPRRLECLRSVAIRRDVWSPPPPPPLLAKRFGENIKLFTDPAGRLQAAIAPSMMA